MSLVTITECRAPCAFARTDASAGDSGNTRARAPSSSRRPDHPWAADKNLRSRAAQTAQRLPQHGGARAPRANDQERPGQSVSGGGALQMNSNTKPTYDVATKKWFNTTRVATQGSVILQQWRQQHGPEQRRDQVVPSEDRQAALFSYSGTSCLLLVSSSESRVSLYSAERNTGAGKERRF